jgi:hypothetical protein
MASQAAAMSRINRGVASRYQYVLSMRVWPSYVVNATI